MKKLIIALFAFAAVFAVAGSASAVDYSDLEVADGTYACVIDEAGYIDCFKDSTKWNDLASQPGADLKRIVVVGSDLHVYYNAERIIAPGVIDLRKMVVNTSTGVVSSDAAYLSGYGGMGMVSRDILSGATNPAIAWIDKTTDAVKIDIDSTVYTTTAISADDEIVGRFFDVFATSDDDKIGFTFMESDGDFGAGVYDVSAATTTAVTVDSALIPAYQDAVKIVSLDSTYDYPVVAYQALSDKDLYLAYSTDGATMTNTSIVTRSNNVVDMDATLEGATNVAVAYSTGGDDPDDFRAVVVTENAASVRADASLDNTYTAYDRVAVDQNASDRLVAVVERSNATQENLDEFTFNGATYDTFNFEQEDEGDAVPELPANNLWKVLIAVLALGLVVGIAAFMKKKKK